MARNAKATPKAKSRIAEYVDRKIEALKAYKSQRDIATEMGFDTSSIISMYKRGDAKVPVDRAIDLARAIEADPRYMYRLALEQFHTKEHIEDVFEVVIGPMLSEREDRIIKAIRAATDDADPELTPEREAALVELFKN